MDTSIALLCLLLIAAACLSAWADRYKVSATPLPEFEALFSRTSGWIGADGDYSVPLGDNKIAWLYSDTFVGTVKDGKRIDTEMINNSVGIQLLGSQEPVRFYYTTTPDGTHKAFVTPDEGEGYFWLFDGIQTSKGLYFFLLRVEYLDVPGGFPFRLIGMSLAYVSNPTDTPDKWKITQCRVPFCEFTGDGDILFGSATLKVGDYIYIYGVNSSAKDKEGKRISNMLVARVPENQFGDFPAWKFLSGGKWGSDFENADPLFPGIATEFSVSYIPGIKHYAAVYTAAGISGIIDVRLSPTPEGPWSEPIRAFECPDRLWHKSSFSYAAKAHPELATAPNELIVTYATNSTDFPDLFNDARLYWPRFVRLTFSPVGENEQ